MEEKSLVFLKDGWTTLVDLRWRWLFLTFFASLRMAWLLFALVWHLIFWLHGDLQNDKLPDSEMQAGLILILGHIRNINIPQYDSNSDSWLYWHHNSVSSSSNIDPGWRFLVTGLPVSITSMTSPQASSSPWRHNTLLGKVIRSPDWSGLITWPGFWPLIGQGWSSEYSLIGLSRYGHRGTSHKCLDAVILQCCQSIVGVIIQVRSLASVPFQYLGVLSSFGSGSELSSLLLLSNNYHKMDIC